MFSTAIFAPYYNFEINFFDFFVILVVEVFFFFFMNNKLNIKHNIEIILLACLLKVGLMSLFLSWTPFFTFSISNAILFYSLLLLLSGCFLETIIFQRELLLSKNDSFDLAFKLSVLSSLVFFTIKTILVPGYPIYIGMNQYASINNSAVSNSFDAVQTAFSTMGSGLIFLILGICLFLYISKNKDNGIPIQK